MKIPASIKIKNNVWKVVYKWNIKNDQGEMLDGLCDPMKKIIYLAHGLSKADAEDSFLHEYLHAVQFEFGLHHTLSDDMQESIAHNFADQLRQNFSLRLKKEKD